MTKKKALTPAPLLGMFEEILSDQLAHEKFPALSKVRIVSFHDSKDWHKSNYYCHVDWLKPLVSAGAITQIGDPEPAWPDGEVPNGEKQYNFYKFSVTQNGLKWWYEQYASDIDRNVGYAKLIEAREDWQGRLDGRGIGAEIRYRFYYGDGAVALAGIEDGYFEFVSFYTYSREQMEKTVTVRLTEAGMKFFDSLPRLTLECA
jgi:hypothetical protein